MAKYNLFQFLKKRPKERLVRENSEELNDSSNRGGPLGSEDISPDGGDSTRGLDGATGHHLSESRDFEALKTDDAGRSQQFASNTEPEEGEDYIWKTGRGGKTG